MSLESVFASKALPHSTRIANRSTKSMSECVQRLLSRIIALRNITICLIAVFAFKYVAPLLSCFYSLSFNSIFNILYQHVDRRILATQESLWSHALSSRQDRLSAKDGLPLLIAARDLLVMPGRNALIARVPFLSATEKIVFWCPPYYTGRLITLSHLLFTLRSGMTAKHLHWGDVILAHSIYMTSFRNLAAADGKVERTDLQDLGWFSAARLAAFC
jgi:hypothetical protein